MPNVTPLPANSPDAGQQIRMAALRAAVQSDLKQVRFDSPTSPADRRYSSEEVVLYVAQIFEAYLATGAVPIQLTPPQSPITDRPLNPT